MRFSIVPLLLVVLPISEIAAFIVVGQRIGVLATIALVILTAIAGSILLRVQGLSAFQKITVEMNEGGKPGRALIDGFMIMLAGLLLMVPGFVTDTIGLLLFIPPVRLWIWNRIKGQVRGNWQFSGFSASGSARSRRDDSVVDLDPDDFRRSEETQNTDRDRIAKDKRQGL